MSRFIIILLIIVFGLSTLASEPLEKKSSSLLTFRQIEAENNWFQSGNAAGLKQMPELFPAELKLGYEYSDGNFHTIFEGQSVKMHEFDSRSYRKIGKTYLFGSFSYQKSFESGLNFSNTNHPELNYPYLLADTVGKDTYDREFFKLKGIISSPVCSQLDWGLSFDYQVGVASQNRDPRPENKVMQANISPGLLYKSDQLRLGLNLIYGYYNEDIAISVVETGAQKSLFQIHGPGVFTYHVSSSFYRLYQQHKLGGGMQLGLNRGNFTNLFHSNLVFSNQTVDDGRRGSIATWAATKNDSELDAAEWSLSDVVSLKEENKVHQLSAKVQLVSKRGTEFIQRLEKINETGLEHWITYRKEQKYYSLKTKAELKYQLISKNENELMNSLFSAALNYSTFQEDYHLPDFYQSFRNLKFMASYLKLFDFSRSSLSAELNFKGQFKLGAQQNFDETQFMIQKIFKPEFDFRTETYFSPGISLGYEVPFRKAGEKFFVKNDFDWIHSVDNQDRILCRFSTGIIF